MADCHDLFSKFYTEKVNLTETKRSDLRTSRDVIRNKIKKHFKEVLEKKQPIFWGQGSYMMRTQVTVLPDKEYDLDDGLYLQNLEEGAEWPETSIVHKWIVEAVAGHTSTEPEDKNTCVRVIYKREYHVDIPIYCKDGDVYKLAHKSKGWIESDPRGITNWFAEEIKLKEVQLRRIIQYLKAWKDYNNSITKLPSGLIITILVANSYSRSSRDDEAFLNTIKNMISTLELSFSAIKPAVPHDDLLKDWSETRKNNFLNKLKKIVEKGQRAIDSTDKVEAVTMWTSLFGSRFPKFEPPNDKSRSALKTTAPSVLGNHDRSA